MKTIARGAVRRSGDAHASRSGSRRSAWDHIAAVRRSGATARSMSGAMPWSSCRSSSCSRRRGAPSPACGTWMPRIETTRTLAAIARAAAAADGRARLRRGARHAARHAVAGARSAGAPNGRVATGAASSMRPQRVAATAHELARGCARAAPATSRPAWWAGGARCARAPRRRPGSDASGMLAQDRRRMGRDRAAASTTDRLFDLTPSAWIVDPGGRRRPARHGAARAGDDAPALVRRHRCAARSTPFAAPFASSPPTRRRMPCATASRTRPAAAAAQVLDHLGRGERPVALVAQDRVLVRRVRALLERAGVRLADETGWKLSTTRAGATVMALLRGGAAGRQRRRLCSTGSSPAPMAAATRAEARSPRSKRSVAAARRRAAMRSRRTRSRTARPRLHDEAPATLDATSPGQRDATCRRGSMRFATRSTRCGALAQLRDDDAGRQALAALGIDPPLAVARRESLGDGVEPLTLAEFTRWVDDVLERVTYRPPIGAAADEDIGATAAPAVDVVVTPLARTMLRPFAAVVMPGADHRSLGATPVDDSLLPRSAIAGALAADPGGRRDAELLAFAQVLRCPRLTLLRRRGDAGDAGRGEPVRRAPSLRACRGARRTVRRATCAPGATRAASAASRPSRSRPTAPTVPADALPQRLSASAFEALRACPYRFFAERVLRLSRGRRARRRGREARLRHLAARRCSPSSIASAAPGARRRRRRGAVCARSATACAPRWASTRPRSCRTTPASRDSCRATSSGCTTASARAGAG